MDVLKLKKRIRVPLAHVFVFLLFLKFLISKLYLYANPKTRLNQRVSMAIKIDLVGEKTLLFGGFATIFQRVANFCTSPPNVSCYFIVFCLEFVGPELYGRLCCLSSAFQPIHPRRVWPVCYQLPMGSNRTKKQLKYRECVCQLESVLNQTPLFQNWVINEGKSIVWENQTQLAQSKKCA